MTAPAVTEAAAHHAVPAAVTGTFVRLKLTLLRNGLRQSRGRTAAFVASLVLVVLFGAALLIGLVALRGTGEAARVVVPLAAVVALGWAVMPLFFSAGDETLDPTRLAMLPLRPRTLMPGLLGASLVGIGPLFTTLLAVGSVIALARGTGGWLAAVAAAPLLVLTSVALARAVAAANTRLLSSRRGRDLAVLSGLVIAIGAQVVNLAAQQLAGSGGLSALQPVVDVLRWVPPSSAVAGVEAASRGDAVGAAAGLLLAAVVLAVVLLWWYRSLERLMTSPDSSSLPAAESRSARRGKGSGAGRGAGRWPEGRTGAVMRRTLQYAWRDPKTKVGWASALGIGLLLPVVLAVQGNGTIYNACWAAGLLGLQMYNQFGQDYSGFWLVAQTIDGPREARQELRGRVAALALVSVPYTVLVVVLTAALVGDWAGAPEALGLALGLLGALIATGVFTSWRFPYSIPQDDGYKNVAPGQGSLAYLSLLGGVLLGAVLCLPLIALTVGLHVAGAGGWAWLVLPVGVLWGLGAVQVSLRIAAPQVASRLPEILHAVSRG